MPGTIYGATMHRLTNRHTFMERATAYTSARQPTAQLIAELSSAFAQMIADDSGAQTYVGMMGFRVVREPRAKPVSMSA
jgi:hypothetical protein